jgi:Type II CAAX prenyl endopeptidase Rce1-like
VAIVVVLIAEGLPGPARLGRRLTKWRVNWIWYAAAIGVPLLVHAVSIALNMAAGAPAPSVTQFQPGYAVLLLFGLRMVNPLDGPVAEEPGWRGFAQPRLQSKWSPLASTAVLGVLITGWHLPLVLMPICPADTHWKIGYCTPCIEARRSGSDHAHLAPGDAGLSRHLCRLEAPSVCPVRQPGGDQEQSRAVSDLQAVTTAPPVITLITGVSSAFSASCEPPTAPT